MSDATHRFAVGDKVVPDGDCEILTIDTLVIRKSGRPGYVLVRDDDNFVLFYHDDEVELSTQCTTYEDQ